jgi:very-short-patch-repair endonuclease
VIEVDGDSHDERQEYDQKRTHWMECCGLRVVRFTNDEVMKNLVAVLDATAAWCSSAPDPSPQPTPRSTGERE